MDIIILFAFTFTQDKGEKRKKSQEILYRLIRCFSYASLTLILNMILVILHLYCLNKLSHGCTLKYLTPECAIIYRELYKTEMDRQRERVRKRGRGEERSR